jgi:hypothetical protein
VTSSLAADALERQKSLLRAPICNSIKVIYELLLLTYNVQLTFNWGSAAVGTIFGACGYVAFHHSSCQALRQNKKAGDNQIKAQGNELKEIKKS